MKSSRIHPLFILMVAAASAACGGHETTAPSTAQNTQLSTSGSGSDSSKTNPQTPPTPAPADSGTTSPSSYTGPVVISGTVVSYVTIAPTAGTRDTLALLPAAGASVALLNASSDATVAHTTADSHGAFLLPSVAAGTYKLQGQAAGSSKTSFMLLTAGQASITVTLYVNSTH